MLETILNFYHNFRLIKVLSFKDHRYAMNSNSDTMRIKGLESRIRETHLNLRNNSFIVSYNYFHLVLIIQPYFI